MPDYKYEWWVYPYPQTSEKPVETIPFRCFDVKIRAMSSTVAIGADGAISFTEDLLNIPIKFTVPFQLVDEGSGKF